MTYNVRGIGGSHGSSALITAGPDPEDYTAVQQWAVAVLGGSSIVKEIKRMVRTPLFRIISLQAYKHAREVSSGSCA